MNTKSIGRAKGACAVEPKLPLCSATLRDSVVTEFANRISLAKSLCVAKGERGGGGGEGTGQVDCQ